MKCASGSTLQSGNPLPYLMKYIRDTKSYFFACNLVFHWPNQTSTFVMPNSHYRSLASVVSALATLCSRQRLVFTLDNMFFFSLFWITEIIIGILNHLQIVLSVSTHNLSDGCCVVGLTLFVQVGRTIPPRVVAVSKKHSLEKVQWAYQKGLRHFGENYVRLSECILCDCDV